MLGMIPKQSRKQKLNKRFHFGEIIALFRVTPYFGIPSADLYHFLYKIYLYLSLVTESKWYCCDFFYNSRELSVNA